jgi:hypothetical protein
MSSQKLEPPAPKGRGRPFRTGNPGRKRGSKNRTTLIAEALMNDEATAMLRKGIEEAIGGDGPMLRFFLERILPKERSVRVDLPPMDRASDAVDALATIIDAVGTGRITPSEGAALASLVDACARTINVTDLELRLDNNEKKLNEHISTMEDELKKRR